MSWAWWRATWKEEKRDRVFFFMRMRFSLSVCLSLSLSILFFYQQKDMWLLPSLPPSLASPQWKISSQLCKKEFHQKMKEKHTHKEKRAETVQARKQRFSKTPATTISRRKQRKKNQSTQQKFKPRILVFFFKNHRKERQTETDRDRQRQRQRQRQRAAKTATRTMRSPREKQRQEKPSSSSSSSSSSFSFLNPLFWGD
jgi:hypothetical protein